MNTEITKYSIKLMMQSKTGLVELESQEGFDNQSYNKDIEIFQRRKEEILDETIYSVPVLLIVEKTTIEVL